MNHNHVKSNTLATASIIAVVAAMILGGGLEGTPRPEHFAHDMWAAVLSVVGLVAYIMAVRTRHYENQEG